MKFFSLAFVLGLFLPLVFAQYFAISPLTVGINNTNGARPFRKDVSELQGAELDLYLLAMQEIQQANQREKLSWFQIAGIHGYPRVDWDGSRGLPGSRYPGYGIHGCQLFLPWHRAYLLLLENVLSKKAIDIAGRYPPSLRSRYLGVARALRLAYWNWDGPSTQMPWIMRTPQVSVLQPNGIQATIKNPLESYAFHPALSERDADITFRNRQATVRQPDGSGRSNYDWVQGNWTGFYGISRDILLTGFTDGSMTFPEWSNLGAGSQQNVELVHGAPHSALGGFMYDLYASSFDPAFFLHHANVDRQWAIFSAIHPDSWFTPRTCSGGTYAQREGIIETENTPLTPFRSNSAGTYHTPRSMRNVKNLGYAYKEVPDWEYTNPDDLTDHVMEAVRQQYSPGFVSAAADTSLRVRLPPRQWSIDVTIWTEAGAAANVYFFIGAPPLQIGQWTKKNNLVFTQAFLGNHVAGTRTSRVPITSYLNEAVTKQKLKDLSPESVQPFLEDQLQWRVVIDGGSPQVNLKSDQQVRVSVVEQKVLSVSKGLTQFGPPTVHGNLTWVGQEG